MCSPNSSPILAIQQYLTEGRTQTARCLAEKAVVIIEPFKFKVKVAWPNYYRRHEGQDGPE
jgi:hypothetical protein